MIEVLAAAWGMLAAVPLLGYARARATAARTRDLARARPRASRRRAAIGTRLARHPVVALVVSVLGQPRRRRVQRRVDDAIARELAVAVDLIGVGVAAGCTPYLAVGLAAPWSPPRIATELTAALQRCALGQSFDGALADSAARCPALRPLSEALRTSTRLGSPVASTLSRLAQELRDDLRRRAEARARTVPVRLCFPLVGCILPAFALLTVVPVVLGGIRS